MAMPGVEIRLQYEGGYIHNSFEKAIARALEEGKLRETDFKRKLTRVVFKQLEALASPSGCPLLVYTFEAFFKTTGLP